MKRILTLLLVLLSAVALAGHGRTHRKHSAVDLSWSLDMDYARSMYQGSGIVYGIYYSSPPTPVNGVPFPIPINSSGQVITSGGGGGGGSVTQGTTPWIDSLSYVNGTAFSSTNPLFDSIVDYSTGTGVGVNASHQLAIQAPPSSNATQTFSLTTGQTSTPLALAGYYGAGVYVSAIGTGTLTAKYSIDGTNYSTTVLLSGQTVVSTAAATGSYSPFIPSGAQDVEFTYSGTSTCTGTVTATTLQTNGQDNILSWAGTALGAPSNYGTSPGAVTVPAVNAYITNSPVLGAGPAIIGKVGIDQTTPGTTNGVQVNAALPAGTNLIGQVAASGEGGNFYNGTTALTVTRKGGTDSSSGATTIVTAATGKSIYVLYFALTSNGTVNANLQSHTTTSNTSLTMYEVANTGIVLPYCPLGVFATTNGEALDLNLSAAISVGYTIVYVEY